MSPINADRLLSRLRQFAAIGATPGGGVKRLALSAEDRQARALLAELARTRGFSVSQDPMANLFIRRGGLRAEAPALLVGSHLDSQICGGRYDGALGVLSAFECLEALEDAGLATELAVEVVAWTNEEGSRFSPGAMGSSAYGAGIMDPAWQAATDADGISFEAERLATLAALPAATLRKLGDRIAGYLELHIEQGPILEREAVPIGLVTGIQGTRWLDVTFEGQTAHAGTTSAESRRDPLAAATSALHSLYLSLMPGDAEARFTVGKMRVAPGAVNAIPQSVYFSVDLRHPDAGRIEAMEAEIRRTCEAAAREARCSVAVRLAGDMPPVIFASLVVDAIRAAAERTGVKSRPMVSGAFHDALYLSHIAPTGMIFVPCRDGLSHNEAEFVEPDAIILGAEMLLSTILELMSRLEPFPIQ